MDRFFDCVGFLLPSINLFDRNTKCKQIPIQIGYVRILYFPPSPHAERLFVVVELLCLFMCLICCCCYLDKYHLAMNLIKLNVKVCEYFVFVPCKLSAWLKPIFLLVVFVFFLYLHPLRVVRLKSFEYNNNK